MSQSATCSLNKTVPTFNLDFSVDHFMHHNYSFNFYYVLQELVRFNMQDNSVLDEHWTDYLISLRLIL